MQLKNILHFAQQINSLALTATISRKAFLHPTLVNAWSGYPRNTDDVSTSQSTIQKLKFTSVTNLPLSVKPEYLIVLANSFGYLWNVEGFRGCTGLRWYCIVQYVRPIHDPSKWAVFISEIIIPILEAAHVRSRRIHTVASYPASAPGNGELFYSSTLPAFSGSYPHMLFHTTAMLMTLNYPSSVLLQTVDPITSARHLII